MSSELSTTIPLTLKKKGVLEALLKIATSLLKCPNCRASYVISTINLSPFEIVPLG